LKLEATQKQKQMSVTKYEVSRSNETAGKIAGIMRAITKTAGLYKEN
jgi:hypothetical protein